MRGDNDVTRKSGAVGQDSQKRRVGMRVWLVSVLGLVVLAAGLAPDVAAAPTAPAAVGDSPNIVMIMTDDQTLEQMRVMPQTQALIGNQGTTFSNFVVTLPLCCPSRSTFLTGQYAFNHGVLRNDGVDGGFDAFDNSTALPVWLQRAGYKTVHIGKFLNGYAQKSGVPVGWDDWQAMVDLGYYDYRINDNGTLVQYGSAAPDYSTDVLAARAVEAIGVSAGSPKPYFLNLSVFAPHSTKVAGGASTAIPRPEHNGLYDGALMPKPPSFNEADISDKPSSGQLPLMTTSQQNKTVARYNDELESLLAVDEAVADVVAAVEATPEADNTVIMFTSDNGFHHGEHRIVSSKGQPYEESIHVPLMVRGPGFTAGATVSALTANIDLAPTIAAIAGATPLLPVDGVNLRQAAAQDRSVILEGYSGDCFTGLRTNTETFVSYYSGEEEFYNLTTDPFQLASLHASTDPARVARLAELRALLDARLPEQQQPACLSDPGKVPLTVLKAGDGTGTVRTNPTGLNCSTDCTEAAKAFDAGTPVELLATADVGSTFTGWSGDCTGATTCTVTMDVARTVTATFATSSSTSELTVTNTGEGTGSVTSAPGGITCPGDCSEPYPTGTQVTLTAAPAAGSTFGGWTGGCVATTANCIVTVNAATTVTATFNVSSTPTLTVVKNGTGSGTVKSTPRGINCGRNCSNTFNPPGQMVTLTATPAANNTFAGWTGCTPNATKPTECTVTVNAATTVTATFNTVGSTFLLTVTKAGTGAGTVTSSPVGISCPIDCTESYSSGTAVTLTALPGSGATFAGWTGACTNLTGTCTVTMSQERSVTATFNPTVAGGFSQVSAGAYHTCGLRPTGEVTCWGLNTSDQTNAPAGAFTQISAGAAHTCALTSAGVARCWGLDGRTTPPAGAVFSQISAGDNHTCGLHDDGTVSCWGSVRVRPGEDSPFIPPPGATFTQVSAGGFHTCGLRTDGTAACWGDNSAQQSTPPTGSFTIVDAGHGHNCGLRSDGTAVCWGAGGLGQTTPPAGAKFTHIDAANYFTCGVKTDKTVACWGRNDLLQASPPSGEFSQVDGGGFHACGVKIDGTIACWGDNSSQQSTPPA